jgi:hypothetical protein
MHKARTRLLSLPALLVGYFTLGLVACSSDGADTTGAALGSGGTRSPGSGASGGGIPIGMGGTAASAGTGAGQGNATGGTGVIIGTGGTSAASGAGGSGAVGNGTPEVCDGVDNDANGIADDVDAGGDGVCDCLAIGTIGHIGPWSDGGNIFASWLNARTPQGAIALGDKVLTAELLAPLQVIVVLHVGTMQVTNGDVSAPANHAFSEAEAAAFGAWVKAGGGVMTTIGYSNTEAEEVVNVNRLLATVDAGYSVTNLDLSGYVTRWEQHAVTAGVRRIFTDNGVEPAGSGTTVAYGENDRVALRVNQPGDGHVVVWGDEWITYDSEWEDVQDQQVELFWLNILKWLSPPKTCQVPIPPDIVR